MSENILKAPESSLEKEKSPFPKQVKRPWVVPVMAIWVFFGISGYLNTLMRAIGRENQTLLQFGSIAILIFAITMILFLLKMNKKAIIIFGVLCVILALLQSVNLLSIVLSHGTQNTIIYFLPYYIVPSIILAFVSLRPKFLKVAAEYTEFKQFEEKFKIHNKAHK